MPRRRRSGIVLSGMLIAPRSLRLINRSLALALGCVLHGGVGLPATQQLAEHDFRLEHLRNRASYPHDWFAPDSRQYHHRRAAGAMELLRQRLHVRLLARFRALGHKAWRSEGAVVGPPH
jgi:hypothetical protein